MKNSISEASKLLRAGKLVAFPTETVYGLGADATNPEAVKKIFSVKGRPSNNPLIVHLYDISQVSEVAEIEDLPQVKKRIDKLAHFWPGPLSLVLPKNKNICSEVTSGGETVAVRIPNHPIALDLLSEVKLPIAAPSANRFQKISPTKAEHVSSSLGDEVAMILDGGSCSVGVESTVVSLVGKTPILLRPGGISREDLEEALGEAIQLVDTYTDSDLLPSPGMLSHHYSPQTPLTFRSNLIESDFKGSVGLIQLTKESEENSNKFKVVSVLSPCGDLEEVARKLFEQLHNFDSLGLNLIAIDHCEETGIGLAIMDRLKKAVRK